MRALITTIAASGHFHPLVPFAGALEAAGHEVAFAAAGTFAPQVEASGFRCFAAGIGLEEVWSLFPETHAMDGIARRYFMRAHVFPGIWPERMLPDLLAVGATWRPDLVVRDASEFAGCVAAESWGIPHASIGASFGSAFPYTTRHALVPQLDILRARVDLPPDPDSTMRFRYLHLMSTPPALRDPATAYSSTTHIIRRVVFDRSGDEMLPDWVATLPDRPTILATLGTVANREVAIFRAILAALQDEPINLILTVGRDVDPETFGPRPANVHIERYIPLSLLLPHCDLVVCHGGFGTVIAALELGIPMVTIPISADQPEIAARCAEVGLGVTIGPSERTPDLIGSAVRTVLADESFRTNAERLRDDIAAMPNLEDAVGLLERLIKDKVPIIAAS
jgi:MGT family glycosyltransferase